MSGYTGSDHWLCFFVTALLKVEVEGPAGCHGLQFSVLTSCVASSFTLPVFVLFPPEAVCPALFWFHLCPFSLAFPAFLYSARSSLFLSVHPSKCFYSCAFLIFALQTSPTFFFPFFVFGLNVQENPRNPYIHKGNSPAHCPL